MTPGARLSAAIAILDDILAGRPAEQALLRWSRASRYAGSGDRAAVRDLVFTALRRRDTHAALGGALTGRGLVIGGLRDAGQDPAALFTGQGHAPAPPEPGEGTGAAQGIDDLPGWIGPLWRRSLGGQAEAVARAMRHRAPVWLRVNALKATPEAAVAALAAEGVATAPHPGLKTALEIVENERRLAQTAAYRDGLVELQDLSPQQACAALPVGPGMRILDHCAGGGGKTLAVAGRAPGLTLVAHDAVPARMADLPARARRAGARVQVTDDPAGAFDLVMADVPCSGSGTWRRAPDSKWRLTPAALDGLTALQARILGQAARHVGRGGHLAYMTCSVLDVENECRVRDFLHGAPDFALLSSRLWTPLDAGDGFYLAVMERR